MNKKLLFLISALLLFAVSHAQQVVSIVGTGVNGWPPTTGPELDMMTTDEVTYTLTNVVVTAGAVKFRLNHAWDTSWGGDTFPTGTTTGNDILTIAGTYTVTFNRLTGAYSFNDTFPRIGIWGPAVDAINGFVGPDVKMFTTDGIMYKLSAFQFTSGSANFRQDNNPSMTYSSTSYPTGTAVAQGPNFFVPGGQWTVYFNRITGAYSFGYPSVGIIGTFNNWNNPDVDMTTTNGETYTLQNFTITDGFCKLRLDDEWTVNWGGDVFPNGTLVLNGNDMPVVGGTYNVTFNRANRAVNFTSLLGTNQSAVGKFSAYPNPAKDLWRIASGNETIQSISVYDISGKKVLMVNAGLNEVAIDASGLTSGIYFAKITSAKAAQTIKLIKE